MVETVKIAFRLRIYPIMAVLFLFGACNADSDAVSGGDEIAPNSYVMGITATIATRADDNNDSDVTPNDNNSYNINELIPYDLKFDEYTILQVSQKGPNLPPFLTDDAIYDYEYITSYVEGPNDWDNDAVYNFTPYKNGEPLEWNKISNVGSINATFAMYCMYFPIENHLRGGTDANGKIFYNVMYDQSTLDNLKKSDILGAYHTTPSIFSRIKFRLHHLMTYIRIRLYVPVYDDTKNTGYRDESLLYATLNGVNPKFSIDWAAVRSSDTDGPMVSGLSMSEEEKAKLEEDGGVKMYQHPLPAGETSRPIVRVKYKGEGGLLPDGFYDQGIDGDYDNVRVYDFSVIIPKQIADKDSDNKGSSFTETNFLNFYLRTNAGGTTRYYFNQSLSANSNQSVLEMNQGVFQYIQLYLPRVGNQVLFVGAKVNPWDQTNSEMFLQPDEIK